MITYVLLQDLCFFWLDLLYLALSEGQWEPVQVRGVDEDEVNEDKVDKGKVNEDEVDEGGVEEVARGDGEAGGQDLGVSRLIAD